jgi:hypothetical protein
MHGPAQGPQDVDSAAHQNIQKRNTIIAVLPQTLTAALQDAFTAMDLIQQTSLTAHSALKLERLAPKPNEQKSAKHALSI